LILQHSGDSADTWPYSLDYVSVAIPPKSWSLGQDGAWFLLQGLNSGFANVSLQARPVGCYSTCIPGGSEEGRCCTILGCLLACERDIFSYPSPIPLAHLSTLHMLPYLAIHPSQCFPRLCSRLISARSYPIPNSPLPLPDRSPPNRIYPRSPRPRLSLPRIHSPISLSNSIRSRRRHPKRIQFNSTSHLYYRPFNMGFTSE